MAQEQAHPADYATRWGQPAAEAWADPALNRWPLAAPRERDIPARARPTLEVSVERLTLVAGERDRRLGTTLGTDRLSTYWARMRLLGGLETLPPFWTALAIIIAVSVPQVFLAVPIAVAGIGPLPAITLVVIFGILNTLTMACMAEAFSRHGDSHYGHVLVERVVSDYLGHVGGWSLMAAMALRVFLGTLAAFIGLSVTLADFTGISPAIWAAAMFVLGAYLLAGKSINFTVGVTVLLGGASILLILVLSLLGIARAQATYLFYYAMPVVDGGSPDPLLLQLVGGVMLASFHGHAYLPQSAKIILSRQPNARSFIWGSVAGTLAITVLLCVWIVAINGAIAPQALAGQSGTMVPLLAGEVGPSATLLGSLLVILLLGTGWVRGSGLLFSLVRERLPAPPQPTLIVPHRRGRQFLHRAGNRTGSPRIGEIWHALRDSGLPSTDDRPPRETAAVALAARLGTTLQDERARFAVCAAPALLVFMVAELLLATGCESFSGVWSIAGVIGNSFIAGIFPVLLLVASRRKGDVVPGVALRFLSHPLFVGGTYLFVVGLLLIHGLVIWQGPVARAAALLAALLAMAIPIVIGRQGAFERRLVVELLEDTRVGGEARFSVIAAGQPATAVVKLDYSDSEWGFEAAAGNVPPLADLRAATFHLPPTPATELKVRARRVTPDGESASLPALLEVHDGRGMRKFDLHLSSGQVIVPLAGLEPGLRITLVPRSAA